MAPREAGEALSASLGTLIPTDAIAIFGNMGRSLSDSSQWCSVRYEWERQPSHAYDDWNARYEDPTEYEKPSGKAANLISSHYPIICIDYRISV